MDLMRYDFTAPEGRHFGVIASMDQMIAELPNAVDYWTPTADKLTQVADGVSVWTGALGRTLSQATTGKRPVLDGAELLFGDGATAGKAELSLDGAAIGLVTDLTIAGRFRLPAAAMTIDAHQMFGMQATQVFRLTHRYSSNNNYVRLDMTNPIVQINCDVPSGQDTIPVVLTVTGGTAVKIVVGETVSTGTLSVVPNLQSFTIGGVSPGGTDWPGWIGKFGIWKMAADDSQIATLQSWLG